MYGVESMLTMKKNNRAILTAREFRDNRDKPKGTQIIKVPEYGEDALFKSYFHDFYSLQIWNLDKEVSATDQIEDLYLKRQITISQSDDSVAKSMTVYVVDDQDELQQIDQSEYGYFYEDNVYVIDAHDSNSRHYVFLWVGGKKSFLELKHCDKYILKVTDYELGDDIIRERLRKGKESGKFLALFENGVVINKGSRDNPNAQSDQPQIYTIYSPYNKEAKAMELSDVDDFYFNSGNVYYFITADNTKLYKWVGKLSNEKEKEFCPKLLFDDKEIIEIQEGEEPDEIWKFLNKESKPEDLKVYNRTTTDIRIVEPRLFLVTNETGYFSVNEIFNFGQEDLDHGDVMILDAYDTLFIWFGRESNSFEKKKSMEVAEFYIEMCINNGRENDLNIDEVEEGNESALFKSYFPDWDDENFYKISDRMKDIGQDMIKKVTKVETQETYYTLPASEFDGHLHPQDHKFTRDELNAEPRPEGVKRARCELYLEDDEFESIFGMSKDEFYQLKDWKRLRLKKEQNLF